MKLQHKQINKNDSGADYTVQADLCFFWLPQNQDNIAMPIILVQKMFSAYCVCCIYSKTLWNTFTMVAKILNPDLTAPLGAVWYGSILFAI